jgi:uncharacterized secreted repeat protein (TIGR03808 family)
MRRLLNQKEFRVALDLDRRMLMGLSAAGAAAPMMPKPARANATALGALGIDVTHFGVTPGSQDDQSQVLQRAIDAAAAARMPLWLPAGAYLAANLSLPSGAQLFGIRGASRLVLGAGRYIVMSERADQVTLQGLVFDGVGRTVPGGLVQIRDTRGFRMHDCTAQASAGNGIHLDGVAGEVSGNIVIGAGKAAIFSLDARGLTIANNTVLNAGNNGIQVWRSKPGDDGTIVSGNRVEEVASRDGGSGQNGNGINIFRAANVMVEGNRIRNCAFSAVRGNGASNLHIRGNAVSALGEVALYAEFGFEGAIISGNTVDGAATGISITNFNEGGRLAVCQGNLIRNIIRGDVRNGQGAGIFVEADASVTGNVIEKALLAGVVAGYGKYLRDVAISGNVIRSSPIGIGVSMSEGAGSALVADNLISGATTGAVIGMDGKRIITGDLTKEDASRYAQVTLNGNRVQ